MRIAYICADPGVPVLGTKGASIHVQQIVRAFRRRGDEVTVYCTRTGDGDPRLLAGARVVCLPVPKRQAAERERAVSETAVELAARARRDGCDLVYERYALFADAAARVGAASIVEVNAPLIDEQRTHRTLADEAGAIAATRRLLGAADLAACVSDPVADWARAHGGGDSGRVLVAPNGVDTASFPPARHAGTGPLRAAFVGSLKPWHGVEVAIEAVAGLVGVELTVIGDGPQRVELERIAQRRGADVRWLGAVPHAEIAGLLADTHVGLAPYPADAGAYFSPLKAFEYLAAGIAVVGSATGQLPAIVEHDRTGVLVPPGDPAALREALAGLRDDRDRTRRLGAAARERAVERHDWDRVLEGILTALPAAVPTAPGPGPDSPPVQAPVPVHTTAAASVAAPGRPSRDALTEVIPS